MINTNYAENRAYFAKLFEADKVVIELKLVEALLTLSFACWAHKEILENGGEVIMREKYGDTFSVDKDRIWLKLDLSSTGKIIKTKKDASQEEKDEAHAKNKIVWEALLILSVEISEKWSAIKRDFMGAPILRALWAVHAKNADKSLDCVIPYRENESFWIRINDKEKMSVIYNVHFTDEIDKTLVKEMLEQLTQA